MSKKEFNPKGLSQLDPERAQVLIPEWLYETNRMFCPLDPEGYFQELVRSGLVKEVRDGVYRPTGISLE